MNIENHKENGCSLDFVAIDFETANWSRDSVCEIGLAIVKGGKIVSNPSWLVRPEDNYYNEFNISIHGIRPEDTENKPSFGQLWGEIRPLIEGQVLVAHNAVFDMYVLRNVLNSYSIDIPILKKTMCSCIIARRLYPYMCSYSLGEICDFLEIKLKTHHRAGDDAAACAELFIMEFMDSGINDFSMFTEEHQSIMKKMYIKESYYKEHRKKPFIDYESISIRASEIIGDTSKHDPDNLFFGKRVVFTGAFSSMDRRMAMQTVADIGGIPQNHVTLKTDILIVGQQDYRIVGEDGMSKKQERAMEMHEKGHHIEVLSEQDFLGNIE
jgi:DNA polymerase-3 subunit epsilon